MVRPHLQPFRIGAARQAYRGAVCSLTTLLAFLLLPVIYHFQLQGRTAAASARSDSYTGGQHLRTGNEPLGPGHDPDTCPFCQASSANFYVPGVALTPDPDLLVRPLGSGYCELRLALPPTLSVGSRSPPLG